MALVAYENSDSSDYEEEDNDNSIVVTLNPKAEVPEPSITTQSKAEDEEKEYTSQEESTQKDETGPSLFNLLPQPTNKKPTVVEEDDEFLHKKETNAVKPKAKITVPSLSDFRDVENSIPTAKPKITNGKKSGLLSLLPQPKNGVRATTKSLIPHVLTRKPNPVKNEPVEATPMKKLKVESKPSINDYSDDSDNEEIVNDFFSINKSEDLPIPEEIEPLDTAASGNGMSNARKPRGIESFFKKEEVNEVQLEPDYDESVSQQSEAGSSYNVYTTESSNSNDVVLDEEAILKLCGTRGKRKREEIQIVDVNQQEVLAEARSLLLKGLMDDTSKRMSASKKKGHEPTNQQRRKHQITYLAYQAKANEAELQNQWANNRMSKRQTQAKYGF